jgi:hypothetical protein
MIYNIKLEDLIQKNKKYVLNYLKKNLINIKTNEQWMKMINENKNNYIVQKIINNKLIEFENNKLNQIFTNNEPNIIIICSGQSNSGGFGTTSNQKIELDQPNENILSYHIDEKKWVLADLSNDSLGSINQNRFKNQNSIGFQFAKNLVNNNPLIKVGLICINYNNQAICNWVEFNKDEKYYNEYEKLIYMSNRQNKMNNFKIIQNIYEEAISKLRNNNNLLNIVIWHQGETDNISKSNPEYYEEALIKLINLSKELTNNKLLGFIGGTILNNKNNNMNSDIINNIIRKKLDNIYNYAELSELSRSDNLHFSNESIRTAGKLYYEAYESIINKLKN